MSISFPSRPVISLDIPEVKDFTCSFIYNFFSTDEKTSEQSTIPEYIKKKKGIDLNSLQENVLLKISRYVQFSFSPVNVQTEQKNIQPALQPGNQLIPALNLKNNLIKNNLDKIQTEEKFCNFGFTGLNIQDTGIDGKFYILMSGTMAKRIADNNTDVANSINNEIENIGSYIDSNNVSLLDVAKYLNGQTDIDIPYQFVINSLNNLKSLGVSFLDDEQVNEQINNTFEKLKSVKTRIRINNKVINDSFKTVYNDSLGLFSDEIGPLLPIFEGIQDKTINNFDSTTISEAEYDIVVEPVSQKNLSKNTVFHPKRKIVGYIIDKFELGDDGVLLPKTSIIIEDAKKNSAFDFNVSYGKKYVYQIRSVAQVELQTTNPDTEELVASTVLVSSSPSPRLVLECVENVPPPCPVDFDLSWDVKNEGLRLMWNFPVNSQRDIKRFQIFKRKTIYEPYELIKEYDFDDSDIKTKGFENPDISLVEQLNSPLTFYIDRDFDKNSKFIYSLCSIDAHGLTSNYSIQFEITFDKFKNKVIKKIISRSGAPKSYPNLYLNQDTFVDTIRDSGHERLRIYFDPEYYSIFDPKSEKDKELFTTMQKNGSYCLQIINADLQKNEKIDIIINDRRSEKNKLISPNKLKFEPLKQLLGFTKNISSK